jgi:hypothetical protein
VLGERGTVVFVARVVALVMGGETARKKELSALRAAGHELVVVEPRFPECKGDLEESRPNIVLVDGASAPSHGRATAGWMASLSRLRTVPFLFLDVPDKDMARVRKEIPRAQFATWASVAGAVTRIAGESAR